MRYVAIHKPAAVVASTLAREATVSTGLGDGIAIPHAEQAAGDAHLTILGALSRKLVNPQFRAERSAAGPDRAYELLTTVQ